MYIIYLVFVPRWGEVFKMSFMAKTVSMNITGGHRIKKTIVVANNCLEVAFLCTKMVGEVQGIPDTFALIPSPYMSVLHDFTVELVYFYVSQKVIRGSVI